MLPWLRKRLTKKQYLLLKVFALAFFIHCFFFIALFFSRTITIEKKIVLHAMPKKGVKVVYIPFYNLPVKNPPLSKPGISKAPQAAQKQQEVHQMQKQSTAIKSVPQKETKKIVAKNACEVKNTPTQTPAVQKPIQKPQAQKTETIKKPLPQQAAPAKPVQKSVQPSTPVKKSVPVPTKTTHNDVSQPPMTSKESVYAPALPSAFAIGQAVEQDVIYVSQEERALFEIQRHLQQELERCWQAPKIMTQDLSCELDVEIDGVGGAKKVVIVKSSGAKLYDILAQKAFRAIVYPQQLRGKTISFTFKGQ